MPDLASHSSACVPTQGLFQKLIACHIVEVIFLTIVTMALRDIPYMNAYRLGRGVQSSTGKVTGSPFKDPDSLKLRDESTVASQMQYNVQLHDDSSRTASEVGVSASLTVAAALYPDSASASASLALKLSAKVHTQSAFIKCDQQFAVQYIERFEEMWREHLEIAPAEITEQEFEANYGDSFVCGTVGGASLLAALLFMTRGGQSEREVQTALDAAASAYGVEGKISSSVRDHLARASESSDSEFWVHVQGVDNPGKREVDLEGILTEVEDFMKNTSAERAAPVRAVILPYSALPGYGGFKGSSIPTDHDSRSRAIDKIASRFYAMKAAMDRLSDVQEHPDEYLVPGWTPAHTVEEFIAWWDVNELSRKLKKMQSACIDLQNYLDSNSTQMVRFPLLSDLGCYVDELPVRRPKDTALEQRGTCKIMVTQPGKSIQVQFPRAFAATPKVYIAYPDPSPLLWNECVYGVTHVDESGFTLHGPCRVMAEGHLGESVNLHWYATSS